MKCSHEEKSPPQSRPGDIIYNPARILILSSKSGDCETCEYVWSLCGLAWHLPAPRCDCCVVQPTKSVTSHPQVTLRCQKIADTGAGPRAGTWLAWHVWEYGGGTLGTTDATMPGHSPVPGPGCWSHTFSSLSNLFRRICRNFPAQPRQAMERCALADHQREEANWPKMENEGVSNGNGNASNQ